MARRTTIIASVFGVWLGVLTVVALHLLLSNGLQGQRLSPAASRGVRRATQAKRDALEAAGVEKTLGAWKSAAERALSNVRESENDDSSDPRAAFERVVALSALLPKISNISRLATPSSEAFRNYIAPVGLPVIFTDMFDGARMRQWTWDYVKSRWGHQVFHNTRQGNSSSKKTSSGKYFVNRVTVKLGDFIDVVTGKKTPNPHEKSLYITKQKVIPSADLETEFQYPPFYPGPHSKCFLEPTAWIGASGTFTQGHLDSKDNFAYQIIGKKRWTIFSPQDYKYLYYVERSGSLEWSTALNSIGTPDLKKYPLYAKAIPVTFTLQAGEVLYLPRGWTHRVENITPSLMINTWRLGTAAITEYWSKKSHTEIKRHCF